jgi:hypothetical protein
MEIQEKYRKDADEFVRRALKNYSKQIESINTLRFSCPRRSPTRF